MNINYLIEPLILLMLNLFYKIFFYFFFYRAVRFFQTDIPNYFIINKTIPVYKGLPPKNHIFLKKSLCFSRQKTSGNPSATDFAGKLPRLQLRAAMRTGRRTSVLMTGKHTADIHLKCLPSEPSVQIKAAQKNQKHWQ